LIIHLDTSLLIDAASEPGASRLRQAAEAGHVLTFSTIVLFEWLRGPRADAELGLQRTIFPESALAPFGIDAARTAARLYRTVKRPRSREFDIAVAACAIEHEAALWTLNPRDFADIPGLTLYAG
jgi:predicted nucleic acid-binding protein